MSDDPREPRVPVEGDQTREIPEEEVDVAGGGGDDEAAEPDDGLETEDIDDQSPGEARPLQEVSQRPRSRAAQRIETVDNENRQLREQIARVDRELTELRAQQRQPTQAELAEAQRREDEAVAMMAPHEVARYYAQKSEQRVSNELNQTRQMLWDQNDAAQFDNLLAQNPTYKRFTDRVEELRRQAPGVSRRILLATAIGMQALDQAPAARTRAQNRAADTLERQRTRPSNGRGDVASPTNRGGGSRWDRLRDVQI